MAAILDVRHLSKTFISQRALDDVSLEVLPGEVHALVGKNGSGKSTLAKVLSGFHSPDHGVDARLLGREVRFPLAPEDRRRLHFVHQDLGLVDSLSVMDNIGLSETFKVRRFWRIDWEHSRERAKRALDFFGLGHLDLRMPLSELTASERAIVAIARGLVGWDGGAGLLVLDETTAALPPHEVEVLERAMQRVIARGSGILYITHRLDEVFTLGDRVSVLRDGRKMGTYRTSELNRPELVSLMIGERDIERIPDPAVRERIVLRCRDLMSADGLQGVDLDIRSGEIVGVAGLLGSGREAIADVIFGARPLAAGSIELDDRRLGRRSPGRSIKGGMALVPSDRARRGILPNLSTRENISLASLGSIARRGRLQARRERSDVARWIAAVGLVPADPERSVSTLSGGNQQKAILARALRTQPRLLILDEATQGVDVGAKRSIHNLVRRAASSGAAVMVCTAEAEDLPALCHRVVVLRDGRIVAEFMGENLTQENVVMSCAGGPVPVISDVDGDTRQGPSLRSG